CASATRFGQTSASTKATALGLIAINARRITGQKSSGLYITSIQSGAFLFAKAKPVVVVVVRTQCWPDFKARICAASLRAIVTSPTLTACSQIGLCQYNFARNCGS